MKLRIRFILFIFFSLCLFVVFSGLIMTIFSNLFSQYIGTNNEYKIIVYSLILAFCSGCIILCIFLINPLFLIISIIDNLAKDKYNLNSYSTKIYNTNGNIRIKYFLYREVINDIFNLSIKLAKVNEEREKLEKAKCEWVRGISHDLKTPLSYILGYSILLENEDYNWSKEETRKFLNEIHSKGEYMKKLISSLNQFTKITDINNIIPLKRDHFDIVSLINTHITDILNDSIYSNCNIKFKSEFKNLYVYYDKDLIGRVIKNLLVNSIIHNNMNVNVDISLMQNDNNSFIMEFKDSGKGLNNETVKFLTNYEYCLNSGKGLAIVKNIVLAHNGIIKVNSAENKGTIIDLILRNIDSTENR